MKRRDDARDLLTLLLCRLGVISLLLNPLIASASHSCAQRFRALAL